MQLLNMGGGVVKIDAGFTYSWNAGDQLALIGDYYKQFLPEQKALNYVDSHGVSIFNNKRYLVRDSNLILSQITPENIKKQTRVLDTDYSKWVPLKNFIPTHGDVPFSFGQMLLIIMMEDTARRHSNWSAYATDHTKSADSIIADTLRTAPFDISHEEAINAIIAIGRHTKNAVNDIGDIDEDPHTELACRIVDTFYDEFNECFSMINELMNTNPWFVIKTSVSIRGRVMHTVVGDYRVLEWEKANGVKSETTVSEVGQF